MSNYTKGPWSISPLSKTTVLSEKELIICNANEFNGPYSEKEANMKLCAASPELFEALKELLEYSNDIKELVKISPSKVSIYDALDTAKSLISKLEQQ